MTKRGMIKMVVTLTKDNFDGEIINTSELVLVDFWADWCGPCRMVGPIIDGLAQEYAGKVKVCKVNIDDNSEIASANAIVSIPTILLFKDGKVVERLVGAKSRDDFEEVIDQYV